MAACAKFRCEKSAGGHSLSVLKSALQKYVRRGEEVLALQAVREFHSFSAAAPVEGQTDDGAARDVQRIRTNYLNRLLVIALEDVGCVHFANLTHQLLSPTFELPFGDARSKQREVTWVRLACRWPKTRSASYLKAVASLAALFPPEGWHDKPRKEGAAIAERLEQSFEQFPQIQSGWCMWSMLSQISLTPEAAREVKEGPCDAFATTNRTFQQMIREPERLARDCTRTHVLMLGWLWAEMDNAMREALIAPSGIRPELFRTRRKPFWYVLSWALKMAHARLVRDGEVGNSANRYAVMAWFAEHVAPREKCLCWLIPMGAALGYAPSFTPTIVGDAHRVSIAADPQACLRWIAAQPLSLRDAERVRDEPLKIEGYVLDQHTGASHNTVHRSTQGQNFAEVGSLVVPEVPPCSAEFRSFYHWRKRVDDMALCPTPGRTPRAGLASIAYVHPAGCEWGRFEFVARMQLVTGNGKTDTYLAYDRAARPSASSHETVVVHDKFVVVKGPFPHDSPLPARVAALARVKREVFGERDGVLAQDVEVVNLERAAGHPYSGPLGLRRSILAGTNPLFLVAPLLVNVEDLRFKLHKSKLWDETVVVDWDAPSMKPYRVVPKELPAATASPADPAPEVDELGAYVKLLMLRYVAGVTDHADRNFVRAAPRMCGGVRKLCALDEDTEPASRIGGVATDLRKNKCELVHLWLTRNAIEAREFVGRLADAFQHEPASAIFQAERLQSLVVNPFNLLL